MLNVKRTSQQAKISGLMDQRQKFFDEMNHMLYLNNHDFCGIKFTKEKFMHIWDISTFLALLINCVILFTYTKKVVFS